MPRENRKRGKKHKKPQDETEDYSEPHAIATDSAALPEAQAEAGPSWIKTAATHSLEQEQEQLDSINRDAPFGEVDSDVKAYFRTVDIQMKQWMEEEPEEEDEDKDPNEERRMFFGAALQEMNGKERQLATDPECSTILERMLYSMDDFARRVFMDALSGSHELLAKHRFASHVLQTLLTMGRDTVNRETKGILPSAPASDEEAGELRTFTQLTLDFCQELEPSLTSLLLDPFASHILRALLVLLAPPIAPAPASSSSRNSNLRSKKSAKWKARQGPMKNLFDETTAGSTPKLSVIPLSFTKLAQDLLTSIRAGLGANEVRAMAADKAASPLLQLLIELEAHVGMADELDSLMDRVLVGMVEFSHEHPELDDDDQEGEEDVSTNLPEASDYLGTLLRDPTSSHLLETLVTRTPPRVFALLYRVYFTGKLGRLANHPVANFVVAKVICRAEGTVFRDVVRELALSHTFSQAAASGASSAEGLSLRKLLTGQRGGVVHALVDRARELGQQEAVIVRALYAAFDLDPQDEGDKTLFVSCALHMKTKEEYTSFRDEIARSEISNGDVSQPYPKQSSGFSTQGSVLLQALLRLKAPHHGCVTESVLNMDMDGLLSLACDPTGSRVIDAFMELPAIAKKDKRKLTLAFVGTGAGGGFERLVDDRIGSRVGDRLWAAAEPYLKEKIARSLVPHEHTLLGSEYGRYFARKLQLHVLRRRPDEWKEIMSGTSASGPRSVSATAAMISPLAVVPNGKQSTFNAAGDDTDDAEGKKAKKKRKADEIDALFEDAGLGPGGKKKRAVLVASAPTIPQIPHEALEQTEIQDGEIEEGRKKRKRNKKRVNKEDGGPDKGLQDVLGAIIAAPKGEKGSRKKSKTNE